VGFNRSHRIALGIGLAFVALSAFGFGYLNPARQSAELIQVSESGFGAFEPAFTPLGDGFAAVWYDTRDGSAAIYFRLLDADGQPSGPEHRVTDSATFSYEADIATVGANLALTWYEAAGGGYQSFLALWTPEGEELWRRTISSPNRNGRIPVVRVHDGEIFCAWVEDNDGEDYVVWGGWWDVRGESVVPATELIGAGPTTWNLNAKIDSAGRAWVVLDAIRDTESEEVFLVRFSQDGERAVRRLTDRDGFASKYPDIALGFDDQMMTWTDRLVYWVHNGFRGPGADRVAITWQDERDGNWEVYLSVVSADELGGVEASRVRITDNPGETGGAFMAWNGPRLGLAWNDDSVGQQELYFQSFDVRSEQQTEARRLTNTEAESLIPAIRPWQDGFALAWNEYTPSSDAIHGSPEARSEIFFQHVQ